MKCSNCGVQNPEGSKFCFTCGQPLSAAASAPAAAPAAATPAPVPTPATASAAPTPTPSTASAAAPQPFGQPVQPQPYGQGYAPYGQPAPKPSLASKFSSLKANSGAAAAGTTGLAAKVCAAISVLVFVFVFFTSWADSPMCDGLIAYFQSQIAGMGSYLGSSGAQAMSMLNSIESPTVSIVALAGATELIDGVGSFVTAIMQYSGGSRSDIAAINDMISSFSVAAGALKVYLVAWIATCMVLAAGVYESLVAKKGMLLLRVGLAIAIVLAIVWMAVCAAASGAVSTVLQSAGLTPNDLMKIGITNADAIGSTIWPILTLVLSALGLVGSFVLKK